MYIDRVPNRNSRPTILLRESWREGKKIKKRTLANMTTWPPAVVDAIRAALTGDRLVSITELFSIERSLPHGHVEAILTMMRQLGLESMIGSRGSRSRDLVIAMIVGRLIHPCSKLANTRDWKETTLGGQLGVADAEVDELYGAMRWLLKRKRQIERRLAQRHVQEGDRVLYDVTSSYYEGRTCPLMVLGHSRDRRGDRPQIVYGVMTTVEGCPVGVEVYPGNTGDPSTLLDQVDKVREEFGLERVVLVGDRGMLTETRISTLKQHPGVGWISALRSGAIRKLIKAGAIQGTLFDKRNLAEITSPSYPGERLVVCYNPFLAEDRKRTRDELLAATEAKLARIEREVARRTKTPLRTDEIALKVGKVIGRYKMKKHFRMRIEDGQFEWTRDEASIQQEEALDGIYVIRTSEPGDCLSGADVVRSYKRLAEVERAFRTLKGLDILVRPIYHRLEETVRAHLLLCFLAYYVEWHLRKALAPLLYDDEDRNHGWAIRDPVAPATPSVSARRKKNRRKTEDGLPVHSFQTLLHALATRCKNWCRTRQTDTTELIELLTTPTQLQKRAIELIKMYPVT